MTAFEVATCPDIPTACHQNGLAENYCNFRVLSLGLLQDGNVGVGVFPKREEILIRGAGMRGVALDHVGAPEPNERPSRSTTTLTAALIPLFSNPKAAPISFGSTMQTGEKREQDSCTANSIPRPGQGSLWYSVPMSRFCITTRDHKLRTLSERFNS